MKAGWQTKKLRDVCVTIQDGAHESPQRQFDSPGKGRFLYITSKNIRNNCLDLGNVSYVEEDFHNRIYPRCKPSVGDVLLTKDGANTGNVTLNTLDEPFSLLSSVCLIKTKPDALKPGFLSYYIQSPDGLESITGQMTGAAIKRIILRDIKLAPIPIPPLSEQRRIVGILDEAFDGLARATANAEQNLRNARALFESHLQSVVTQRGEGWVDRKLDSLCREITVGYVGPMASEYTDTGVTFLRSQNIRPFHVSLENVLSISREFDVKIAKSRLRPGDVAVVRTGYPGTAAVIPASLPKANCADLVIVRPGSEVEPQFLAAFFNSSYGKLHVSGKVVGAAQKHFNVGAAKETVLHLPPLQDQRRIIVKFNALAAETQRLESIYQQKLAALGELKKSLLHEACSGKL
ncbi:putative Type I restriction-modification system, specificity subunit [Nitrospira defluvii]|jgi:type I restriction enzyme S subunit|uniref:Putative Type I restriction-modification system, specificity subunit n=1 Tax=Nitrospira defluvii TaxID=330214 RepID=D8PGE3_9BACT|nr:putative Type I restriction-modification system, specificity subunit [Nitrospira defluvii]